MIKLAAVLCVLMIDGSFVEKPKAGSTATAQTTAGKHQHLGGLSMIEYKCTLV